MDLAIQRAIVEVSSIAPESNAQLAALIAEVRRDADAFVFIVGGAAAMDAERQQTAVKMLDALTRIALEGYRFAVGDGGTQAGIMEAAGKARRASGDRFALVGVAPTADVPPRGRTPLDPNHSHIVTVTDPSAPHADAWGTETETMYWIFSQIATGRPSIAVLMNGGRIALTEVAANVKASRPIVVIKGSGRAADAIASLLEEPTSPDREIADLRAHAESLGLPGRRELFRVLPVSAGAEGLRDAIVQVFRRP